MGKNILAPAATNIWVLAASFFGEKVSEMWLDLVAIYPPLYTIFFAESPANARKSGDWQGQQNHFAALQFSQAQPFR